MNRKQRNIFNFLALLFLLIVLPVAALYFLDLGVDYRKELLAELGDHGKTPGFSLVDHKGDTIDNNEIKRKLSVVNFMSVDQSNNLVNKGETLQKLVTQFGDREEVVFLNFIPYLETDSLTRALVQNFKETYGLTEAERCFFLFDQPDRLEKMAGEEFDFTFEKAGDFKGNPYLALCDTSQTIRRHYNILENKENQLLVRHMIMFLPAGESREGKYEIE